MFFFLSTKPTIKLKSSISFDYAIFSLFNMRVDFKQFLLYFFPALSYVQNL